MTWTPATAFYHPADRPGADMTNDPDLKKHQQLRRERDTARYESQRRDGVIHEETITVDLAKVYAPRTNRDLVDLMYEDETPNELSAEQVSALYGIPVYENPGESPEARFKREALEAAETSRVRSVLERLRVLEREKAR